MVVRGIDGDRASVLCGPRQQQGRAALIVGRAGDGQ